MHVQIYFQVILSIKQKPSVPLVWKPHSTHSDKKCPYLRPKIALSNIIFKPFCTIFPSWAYESFLSLKFLWPAKTIWHQWCPQQLKCRPFTFWTYRIHTFQSQAIFHNFCPNTYLAVLLCPYLDHMTQGSINRRILRSWLREMKENVRETTNRGCHQGKGFSKFNFYFA